MDEEYYLCDGCGCEFHADDMVGDYCFECNEASEDGWGF